MELKHFQEKNEDGMVLRLELVEFFGHQENEAHQQEGHEVDAEAVNQ